MVEKTLSFETEKVKVVEGLAKILQSALPHIGYKPIPSPGVIIPQDDVDNRTYYFESGSSGCYYKFRLDKGKVYRASIQFKNFREEHYETVLQTMSQRFPQFFLAYA